MAALPSFSLLACLLTHSAMIINVTVHLKFIPVINNMMATYLVNLILQS